MTALMRSSVFQLLVVYLVPERKLTIGLQEPGIDT